MADGMAARREITVPTYALDSGHARSEGRVRALGRQCSRAGSTRSPHHSEPAPLRLTRLAECEPALSECLHLEISNVCGIDSLRSPLHARWLRASPIAWNHPG